LVAATTGCIQLKEEFEDTKGVIRICKSKKDRQRTCNIPVKETRQNIMIPTGKKYKIFASHGIQIVSPSLHP
jgi:hypothetical protein